MSAQDLLMTLKDFGELVTLWVQLLKDYSDSTIHCLIHCPCKKANMNEESVESVEKVLHEVRRAHETELKMQSAILETTSNITRSLERLEELLNKIIIEINERKSSYGEVVVQAFEKLPENKKLACFVAFMGTIEKFQNE